MTSSTPDHDPIRISQEAARPTLPRRFYKEVTVKTEGDGSFSVCLDGRGAKTTGRKLLALPSMTSAEAVAQEWRDQVNEINPATMPMTRLAASALDVVLPDPGPVVQEIAKYGGSDLLCYRAADPRSLAESQTAHWDPLLAWMDERFGARFMLAEGVMHVSQPQATLDAIEQAVRDVPAPFATAALHVLTTLSGSVVLALAVAHGRLSPQDAWIAAHVDEDHQIARWGADEEATRRRDRRFADFDAAAKLFALTAAT